MLSENTGRSLPVWKGRMYNMFNKHNTDESCQKHSPWVLGVRAALIALECRRSVKFAHIFYITLLEYVYGES